MDKLKECAKAFEKLFDIEYKLILGRKGKTTELILKFEKKDFHHLVGLHKLKDLGYLKKDRGIVFDNIMKDKITHKKITKSSFYYEDKEKGIFGIEERVKYFEYIEQILDSNNLVFKFNKNNNKSKIRAEFIFENQDYGRSIYVFIDKDNDSEKRYCKSFFPKNETDYSKGHTRMTLLYKEKINLSSGESNIQLNKLRV